MPTHAAISGRLRLPFDLPSTRLAPCTSALLTPPRIVSTKGFQWSGHQGRNAARRVNDRPRRLLSLGVNSSISFCVLCQAESPRQGSHAALPMRRRAVSESNEEVPSEERPALRSPLDSDSDASDSEVAASAESTAGEDDVVASKAPVFGREEAAELVKGVRAVFNSGRTRSVEWREKQLKGIVRFVEEQEEAIFAAVHSDMRRGRIETIICETAQISNAAKLAARHLRTWMRPEKVTTNLVNMPGSSEVVPEPYGAVLIFSPWNLPFVLSLEPLLGAVAAGNAVVIKPSELAPASSALLARQLARYVDGEAVRVVEGGADVATALLDHAWDKIFFTGSTAVGRVVMAAAAKHLTPVTLELGGKNPAFVDASADLQVAARRIASGMCLNAGQACLSPDYVLVDARVFDEFLQHLQRALTAFFTSDPSSSPDLGRIATHASWQRLHALLAHPDINPHIVFGGQSDQATRYIAPTILTHVPWDAPIMQQEGFGPIITLLPVGDEEEAMAIVNKQPKPLAVYVFTTRSHVADRFIAATSSGAVVVNDATSHFTNLALPFGGVGASGMGGYHGKHSFDCFSHRKAVLRKSTFGDIPVRYPPGSAYNEQLVYALMHYHLLQFVLLLLGFGRRKSR